MADIIFNLEVVQTSDSRLYDFRFQKQLDGTVYNFRVKYSKRVNQWVMDIDSVIKEMPLVGGIDLLKQFKHLPLPQGELRVIDTEGFNRDPGEETFGEFLVIQYTEAS
jgi:hypothetical protein